MNIVFLDVDGVLNHHEWFKKAHEERLDPACIGRVGRLCRHGNAQIVVSSTWRLGAMHIVRRELAIYGCEAIVIGSTPDLTVVKKMSLYIAKKRGDEIQAWIDTWHSSGEEAVDHMVILDDDSDMAHLKPWLVKTSFKEGFTERKLAEAIAMLARPAPVWRERRQA